MVRLAPCILRRSASNLRREVSHIIKHYPLTQSMNRYLNDLLSKLNSEGRSESHHGIRRFFKAKKISNDINGYWKQVQTAKENFLVGGVSILLWFCLKGSQIRTTTTTTLAISNVQDQLNKKFSALTDTVDTSGRNLTSTMKDGMEEIRTMGVQYSETLEKFHTTLQDFQQHGLYKGVVCNFW